MQDIDFSGINRVSFHVRSAEFKVCNKICVINFVGDCEIPIIETYSEDQFLDLYYKMQDIAVDLEAKRNVKRVPDSTGKV